MDSFNTKLFKELKALDGDVKFLQGTEAETLVIH